MQSKRNLIILLSISAIFLVSGSFLTYRNYQRDLLEQRKIEAIMDKFKGQSNYLKDNDARYLSYYDQYKKADIKSITYIVNKDIDKQPIEYSTNLGLLAQIVEFDKDKIGDYLNYLEKNKEVSISDTVLVVNNEAQDFDYSEKLISILKEKYFIQKNLKRYLEYANKTNNSSREVVSIVNCNADREFYTNIEDTDISVPKKMLVNKYHKLSKNYVPKQLVKVDTKYSSSAKLDRDAYQAFIEMANSASKIGLILKIGSGYRSYNSQKSIYNYKLKTYGIEYTKISSAQAGHSEHQTGLAMDLKVTNNGYQDFNSKDRNRWLIDNSYKYGLILRYPKDKTYLTGYKYESWHYRYVGVEIATYIYENKITFDEYYSYFIENKEA